MIEDEEPTISRPHPPTQPEQADHASTIQVPLEEEAQQPIPDQQPSPPSTTEQQSTPAQQTLAAAAALQATPAAPVISVVAEAPALRSLPFMGVDELPALQLASDPQISPDGVGIAFSVLHCDVQKNATGNAIWLVSSTGGKAQPARQLTDGAYHDTLPRWSPDGRTLAFLSDRAGSQQIYLLPMDGGEPRQLSTLPRGVTEYSWRPDGQVFLAHGYWKPEDDQETPGATDTARLYTRLGERWEGHGHKQQRHLQLWLVPLEGAAIRLTSEPVDLEQSCWSPNGQEVAFCANRRSNPDLSASMALWVLTLATGQMRRLTPEEGLAQMPCWSPDGQMLAYLSTPDQTEAGNMSPWIVAPQGPANPHPAVAGAEELTCQSWIIDELRSEWLVRPQWFPDSHSLLVSSQERGQVHLYRLDLAQNSLARLTSGNGRYLSPHLSSNGQAIALVRADWFTPGDIWSMDSSGKSQRKLSRINDSFLQGHQLIRPRRITWQSFDGLEIEGWLYLPVLPSGSKAPLILAVHGGPSLAWGDSYVHEFQVLAGRGYAVFAPNPRGSAGYGEAFSRKVVSDWGGADFHDLMSGLDHVLATEPVDENRLGIGGISYGGYMTNWAITQTDRFKAAVSRNGISSIPDASLLSDQTVWFQLSMNDESLQRERSALTFADRIQTPLLLLHAENDLRCPFSESMQLFVSLRKRKHLVELISYPNAGHLMDWPDNGAPQQRVDRLRRTVAWFEHYL